MSQSQLLFQRAQKVIPSGVNSPVRAFNNVGGAPLFIQKADGAYIYDVDNKKYVDYVGSWGPMILGHNHPDIQHSVMQACQLGLSYGAPTEVEIELAEQICALIPSIDKIRMVNSGTEATMSAIRVARGFTHRDKIIKFEGCYHGHADHLLVKAGSGALTSGHPSSLGVPESFSQHTIVCNFNDLQSVQQVFQQYPSEIAAVIVEPVAGNMNCIPPVDGFLEGLRSLCNEFNSLLIFDEVMTGFRVALGGAQALYNIQPDLTCFGKIIGGGMPVGAFGGKEQIMRILAPEGGVYQAGTLSGNPIAMHAGLTCIRHLTETGVYPYLNQITQKLTSGLTQLADKYQIPLTTHQIGGMFGLFFSSEKNITTYQQAIAVNSQLFNQFFHLMLEQGIYFAPSAFEAGFMSLAHTDVEIQKTLNAADRSFAQLQQLHRH